MIHFSNRTSDWRHLSHSCCGIWTRIFLWISWNIEHYTGKTSTRLLYLYYTSSRFAFIIILIFWTRDANQVVSLNYHLRLTRAYFIWKVSLKFTHVPTWDLNIFKTLTIRYLVIYFDKYWDVCVLFENYLNMF